MMLQNIDAYYMCVFVVVVVVVDDVIVLFCFK